MARLYSNENFPLPAVEELRRLGHDVLTVQEAGQANKSSSDAAVLQFATSDGRMMLTLNRRHFVRLHDENIEHSGIIVCAFDPDSAGLAQRIHQAIQTRAEIVRPLIRVNRAAPHARSKT
ncbi:MAG: DUF5615 family PIN-like protein [Acidobacteriota bacterium]